MKLLRAPLLRSFPLFLVLAAGICVSNGADSRHVSRLFKDPPRDYSTGPLWTWNDLLTEQEIRETLRDLAAQKVKQVWIHPRPGLMTPYLSSDWFRLWKVALQEARRLDMNVWIYDENSYPSGFAGGLVPAAMPQSRGVGLTLSESTQTNWNLDNVLAVYRIESNACPDVTARLRTDGALPPGRYLVASQTWAAVSPWHANQFYVNLLSPGVTEKFLELTLEPYRREIGNQFGKRVPGVFSDEPNIRPAGRWPWSGQLLKAFQTRWGYSLLDSLPSLNRQVGDWKKVRHNYFQVLNDEFIEHWSKPYHDYCEAHHLEWTGHYWDHEWPNCVLVPDNMAMYAWHQRPGIDCLMNQYAENTHAQFGNVRMVKELSSVANQLGLKRTLCEVYGAGGWDLRLEDMKRIGDWLEVLGVNTLNQHLSYVTIRGARKRDHPQSFSYHEPWWEAYHVSATYLARLSAVLSQGEQDNPVLVLEPTTTAWMYQGEPSKLDALSQSFCKLLMALEAAQVEYDICSEDILRRHGKVQTGDPPRVSSTDKLGAEQRKTAGLRIGSRVYQTLLMPPMTENLNFATVKLFDNFLNQIPDAQVLCFGKTPACVDGAKSDRVASLAANPRWKQIHTDQLAELLTPGRGTFRIRRTPNDRGILFHHRRHLSDGDLLFLVNTSSNSPSSGIIESEMGSIEQWNLYDGTIRSYFWEATTAGIRTSFNLAPSGSLLLFLSQKVRQPRELPSEQWVNIPPISAPEIHRLNPNVLTLDYADVSAGGETRSNLYAYQANQFAWRKNGLERNPWDSAVQFKDQLISRKFPTESGFTACYHFRIEGPVPKKLAVVIEQAGRYSVSCNGHPLKSNTGDWWLDKSFARIDLGSAAQTGENVITVQVSPFTVFDELEPAYVLGDFALNTASNGFVIVLDQPLVLHNSDSKPLDTNADTEAGSSSSPNPDAWNAQGLPFYGGPVSYRQLFDVETMNGRYVVRLGNWNGSVAKITVNGQSGGFIDAPPYESEVTRYIHSGSNQIEVTVIGTLKNTLGPHHGKPAWGAAWPAAFHKAPETGPPPGRAYDTIPYGLFEPFILKNSRAATQLARQQNR